MGTYGTVGGHSVLIALENFWGKYVFLLIRSIISNVIIIAIIFMGTLLIELTLTLASQFPLHSNDLLSA